MINQVNSPSMPKSNINARDPLNQAHHQQCQNFNSSVSRKSTGARPYNPPGVPPPQQRQYGTPHHYQHPQNQNQQGGNQGQASIHAPQHARTIPTQPQQAQQAGQGYKFGYLSRSVIAKGKKGGGRDEKAGINSVSLLFCLWVGFISMRCAYIRVLCFFNLWRLISHVLMSYCIRRFHSRTLQMTSSSQSQISTNDPIILS